MILKNKAQIIALLTSSIIFFITGCTSSSEETVEQVSQPQTSPKLHEVMVPDNFNWSTHSEVTSGIQLVSNYTYVNDTYASLGGHYIISIHGVDQNNKTITAPVFTGMSNKNAYINIKISIPGELKMLEIRATQNGNNCQVRIEPQYLSPNYLMGCNIFVNSDR